MVSLGAVLEQFPDEVIMYITDPRTGIQRRSEWPPSLAKVVEACEEHQDFLKRARTNKPISQRLPPPDMERPAGCLANVFVPKDHAKYEKMVEWAKDVHPKWWKFGQSSDGRNGIWIPLPMLEGRDPTKLEEHPSKRRDI